MFLINGNTNSGLDLTENFPYQEWDDYFTIQYTALCIREAL